MHNVKPLRCLVSPRTVRKRGTLALGLVLVALSAAPAGGGRLRTVRLTDIVPEYMPGDLETAVLPTPQRAALGQTAFWAGRVAIVHAADTNVPAAIIKLAPGVLGDPNVAVVSAAQYAAGALRTSGVNTVVFVGGACRIPAAVGLLGAQAGAELRRAVRDRGPEAYVLLAAAGGLEGRNVVVLAGNAPAGDFRAFATLRQMVFTKGGRAYVRQGRVADWPTFAFRGNKRPRAWEWRYKANYGWFFEPPKAAGTGGFRREHYRTHGAWIRHGDPLTATDGEMDRLVAGYDAPGKKPGHTRHVAGAREYYRAGCREFVLKFDDSGSAMSEQTAAHFGADGFFRALHQYLTGMHRRLKALDPNNRVFFMPRPYYANSFEIGEYARSLLAYGPLPAEMGLSVCGPEVISRTIPTGCLREFREMFGLKAKAQIYDNRGRGGDYFACTGRDPDLWKEVDCLFPERGTPVTRITVYDYLWNPAGYDPNRAFHLAVRELAGRRPEVYAPLLDYLRCYNAGRDPPALCPRMRAVEHVKATNRRLKAKHEALVPLLARSPLAVETRLAEELWGPKAAASSYEWGEYARLRRRLEFEPYVVRFAYREARAIRAAAPVAVDGRLDEPAWAAASASAAFVRPAWGTKQPPADLGAMEVAGEEETRVQLLYTPTHVYVGISFGYRSKPELPSWARSRWRDVKAGRQANLAWRVPCFELFLDVRGRREDYYHLITNVGGVWLSKHFGAYEPGKVGRAWVPQCRFAWRLGERAGTYEASLRLADLGVPVPRPGDAWGFQCFRSRMGPVAVFSGVWDYVGGEHAPNQFGRIVFE